MDSISDPRSIVVAARAEAARMRGAIAGQDGAAPVRMSSAQFDALATLIDQLADRCAAGSSADCWLDRTGPVGIRSWVPLALLDAAQRRVAACQAEVAEARSQLEAREAENIRLTSLAFGVQPVC